MQEALKKIAANLRVIAQDVRPDHPIRADDLDAHATQLEAQAEMIEKGLV